MLKRTLHLLLCIGMLAVILAWPEEGRCETRKKAGIETEQPLEIAADRMEAYSDRRMVVFSGNAVATQGVRTIRAERLTLHYREEPKRSGRPVAPGESERAGNLERVEAKGNVTITEGDRVVTGDQALFEQDAQRITMTGRAVLREGDNRIQGDKIVVFLNENRGVVEGAESRRVTATIYPGEKKKQ